MIQTKISEVAKGKLEDDLRILVSRFIYGYEKRFRLAVESGRAIQQGLESLSDQTFRDLDLNTF
jgi:hypothetical protein